MRRQRNTIFYFLISISCLLILLLPAWAGATDYYVTQTGGGGDGGDGSVGDPWSVAEFNALSGTGYAGDTVYFRETITTTVYPRISGTSGNYVTLDGYEAGDCDPLNSTCSSSALLTGSTSDCAMWVNNGDDYLIIQDFRMTTGNLSIYTASGTAISTYITVQRNYVYDTNDRLFNMWRGSASTGPSYITLDGNKMVGFGKTNDCPGGMQFYSVSDVIVKNNEFGHTGSTQCCSANTIEVHSVRDSIFEYNEIYGSPQQAGIAVKEFGSNNIVIRFNNIHDNGEGTNAGGRSVAINWPETYNIYIYGNSLHDNSEYGIDIFDGCHDVYVWSNLIYNNPKQGIVTWFESGRAPGDPRIDDIYIYNNTVYNNGFHATADSYYDHTGIALKDSGGTNIYVKNNILMDNRPDATVKHQLYSSCTFTSDYNLNYHPDGTATWYYGSAQHAPSDHDANNSVDNPDMVSPAGGNFTLQGDSPARDGGADLSGLVGSVTIQGTTYNMYWDDGLDPSYVDFSTIPPTVRVVKQDDYGTGWEQGAFAYIDGAGANARPTNYIYSPASYVTITVDATQALDGYSNDPEGDAITYTWVIPAETFKEWAVGTAYIVGDLVEDDGADNGDFYRCILNNTGNAPPNATYWEDAEAVVDPGTGVCDTAGTYVVTFKGADATGDGNTVTRTITVGGTTVTFGRNTGNTQTGDMAGISQSSPTTNYGSEALNWVRDTNTSSDIQSVLMFDLASIIGESVTACTLYLWLNQAPSVSLNMVVYEGTDIWTEDTVNYNTYDGTNAWSGNPTTLNTSLPLSSASSTGQYYAISGTGLTTYVTSIASSGGTVLLVLKSDTIDGTAMQFVSDDGTDTQRPYLAVTYGAGTGATVPYITHWVCDSGSGSYKAGDTIGPIKAIISEPVTVTATPQATVDTDEGVGANDVVLNFVSGSGSQELNFGSITVTTDHGAANLDMIQVDLNGGTITATDDATPVADTAGILDVCPTGADVGSLATDYDINIDVTAATTASVNNTCTDCSKDADSPFTVAGTLIVYEIELSESSISINADPGWPRQPTNITGTGSTVYADCLGLGDDTSRIKMGFHTTAQMRTLDLNFTGDLDLGPGGSITDSAGNPVNTSMGALTLADVAAIVIAVPYPSTSPKEFTDAADYVAWLTAGNYAVINDHFKWTEDADTENFDASGEDGTSGNEITYDGQGYRIKGNQTFGDYSIIKRFIHGSTVILGLGNTHKYSLIPEGDTLQVPEGATGCNIYNDGIRGTLDLDEAVNVYNTWIATLDLAGLGADEPVVFYNCGFIESEAVIEAKNALDDLTFTDCLFEINTTTSFINYAGGDFRLVSGSGLIDTGYDTGVDIAIDGRGTPRYKIHDIGPYEYPTQGMLID